MKVLIFIPLELRLWMLMFWGFFKVIVRALGSIAEAIHIAFVKYKRNLHVNWKSLKCWFFHAWNWEYEILMFWEFSKVIPKALWSVVEVYCRAFKTNKNTLMPNWKLWKCDSKILESGVITSAKDGYNRGNPREVTGIKPRWWIWHEWGVMGMDIHMWDGCTWTWGHMIAWA
jgi:hypothetical protein